jgi:glycosyltransferase involved in cell wall biosynthesis
MNRPRVAMVVQRCGVEVNGGAEVACLEVARAMSNDWDVSIVTTTARDYMTWESFYEPGEGQIGEVRVLRFPVDAPRSPGHFDRLSQRLLGHMEDASLAEQQAWMKAQGPYSTPLLRHLEENREAYDAIFFFTYLYATTYFGLPIVRDRAVLVPFAHDEWPIHIPFWTEFFHMPRRFMFSTPEERDFLFERFPSAELRGDVVGVGIRAPDDARGERFRQRFGLNNPYALYVGRIDPSKGCEKLIADFSRYKELNNDDLILILLGREAMPIPQLPYLRSFGFVDEDVKYDAIRGAEMLLMPSALESLSLVLLEAWSQRRPVLVNAGSPVLVGQCRRAGGGLWYTDEADFCAAIPILREPETAAALGASGEAFVARNYTWDRIAERYRGALAEVAAARGAVVIT